jgi:protein pelota
VEKHIPKKKSGSELHAKELDKFYDLCFTAIKSVDFSKIKCFIVASPGYIKEGFKDYVKKQF